MSREIKFRGLIREGYEEDEKDSLFPLKHHWDYYGIGGKPHLMGWSWIVEDLQFTGLRDKNGVEIYEGDVIELDGWRPKRWEITFDRGGFCMRDKPDASYYPDCKYTERAVVIGNVYEQPELLAQPETQQTAETAT